MLLQRYGCTLKSSLIIEVCITILHGRKHVRHLLTYINILTVILTTCGGKSRKFLLMITSTSVFNFRFSYYNLPSSYLDMKA